MSLILILIILLVRGLLFGVTQSSCPDGFIGFADVYCSISAERDHCPFYDSRLLAEFKRNDNLFNFLHKTYGEQFQINITAVEDVGYYKWTDLSNPNYGLALYDLIDYSPSGNTMIVLDGLFGNSSDNLIATPNHTNTVCLYYFTNYDRSFCKMYNTICGLDSSIAPNCYCRRNFKQFCQSSCDFNDINLSSNCSNCDLKYELYGEPKIQLDYDNLLRVINIRVISHLKLMSLTSDTDIIVCFTNAGDIRSGTPITKLYAKITKFNQMIHTDKFVQYQFSIKRFANTVGIYWCEAYDFLIHKIESNKIIIDDSKRPGVLSVTMNITFDYQGGDLQLGDIDAIRDNIVIGDGKFMLPIYPLSLLYLYPKTFENASDRTIAYKVYVTNTSGGSDAPTLGDFYNIVHERLMQTTFNLSQALLIMPTSSTFSMEYCLGEFTNHFTWQDTDVGITTIPKELCLQKDGSPVTRTCLGDYLSGAYWSDIDGICDDENEGSPITKILNATLYNSSKPIDTKLNDTLTLIADGNHDDILPIDVHLIAAILCEASNSTRTSYNVTTFVEIVTHLMDFHRNTLKDSQSVLNSTDRVLYCLDLTLNQPFDDIDGRIVTKNLQILTKKVFGNRGIITVGGGIFNDDFIQPLPLGTTIDNLNLNDLKIAAFIPQSMIQQILTTVDDYTKVNFVMVVFKNNQLFHQHKDVTNTGYQVGFYLTNFPNSQLLNGKIAIIFKPDRRYRARIECTYWKYGLNSVLYNTKGQWDFDHQSEKLRNLHLCEYQHLTHFSLLIEHEESLALDLITGIGCALSSLACLAVLGTGIFYRNWREIQSTKILLNFVAVLIIQNIVLFISGGIDGYLHENTCVFIGALLHYIEIVQFSWMLIIGYLQYRRYVIVFKADDDWIVVKFAIFAWVWPLIPIGIILGLSRTSYVQERFCYLSGDPLKFAVFLPISIVMIVNLAFFFKILRGLSKTKGSPVYQPSHFSMLHLRLFVLLFFIMGLYWIFGILAGLTRERVFSYIFCLFASSQGVIIFIYFIVLNEKNANFWRRCANHQ